MSLLRVLGIWALLAVVMSANGVLRETILRPKLGSPPADVLSAVVGIALILVVTAFGFRRLAGAPLGQLVGISVLLVAITVAFEFVVGRTVDHKSWADLFGNYAIWRGQLWPLVLLVVALTPLIWGRWAARR
jgi:hypothetical protein